MLLMFMTKTLKTKTLNPSLNWDFLLRLCWIVPLALGTIYGTNRPYTWHLQTSMNNRHMKSNSPPFLWKHPFGIIYIINSLSSRTKSQLIYILTITTINKITNRSYIPNLRPKTPREVMCGGLIHYSFLWITGSFL